MVALWDRIQNWSWKRVKYKENKDYVFIDVNRKTDDGEEDKITGIQIIKGKYKDVVYHYNKARVSEQGAMAVLQFSYTTLHPGEHDIDELQNDQDFVTLMGDILTEIMLAKADNESTRTNNPQELDLQ